MRIDRELASRMMAITAIILFAVGGLRFLMHVSDLLSFAEVQGEISKIETYNKTKYIGVQNMHGHRYIAKYTVNGKEYENIIRKPAENAEVGTPVIIKYKRSDPSVIIKDNRIMNEEPILWWILGGVTLLMRFTITFMDRFDLFAEQ